MEHWSSGSEGQVFESQHFKLAGHFSQFILLKNVCLKRRKNEKEAGDGPSLKKQIWSSVRPCRENVFEVSIKSNEKKIEVKFAKHGSKEVGPLTPLI